MSNRPSVRQVFLAGVICFIPYCFVIAAQPRADRTQATAGKSSRAKERLRGSRVTQASTPFKPVIIYYGSSTSGADSAVTSNPKPRPTSAGPAAKSNRPALSATAPPAVTKKPERRVENIISLEPVTIYYKVYAPPAATDMPLRGTTRSPSVSALSSQPRESGKGTQVNGASATIEPLPGVSRAGAGRALPSVTSTTPKQPSAAAHTPPAGGEGKETRAREMTTPSTPEATVITTPESVKAGSENAPPTSTKNEGQVPASTTVAENDDNTMPETPAGASKSIQNQPAYASSAGLATEPVQVPPDTAALNNMAVRLTSESRFDEASQMLKRAIDTSPDTSFKLHRNLSIVYERMNRMEDARAAAATAVGIAPREPSALMQLCGLELITGRNTEAVSCFARLLEITPTDVLIQTFYGVSLLRTGDHRTALQILEKAAATAPANAASLNALGLAYFNHKKYSDAVQSFKQAVELDPKRGEIRYNLAIAQMASQNKEGATSQYRVLKEENPQLAEELYRTLYKDNVVFVDELKKP